MVCTFIQPLTTHFQVVQLLLQRLLTRASADCLSRLSMFKNLKYILGGIVAGAILGLACNAFALSTYQVVQGGTGQSTFTPSQLLYGNLKAGLSSVGTTTLTATTPLNLSNPVAKVGGSNSILTISTTTDSLFSGASGQVLSYGKINGVTGWFGVATTTPGTGITYDGTSFNNSGVLSITASSPLSRDSATGNITISCATCNTSTPFNWPWDVKTVFGTTTQSTTTPEWFRTGVFASSTSQFTNSTSSNVTIVSNFWNNGITSALALYDSNHLEGAYAGSSNPCTNQFPTTISAVGTLGGCGSVTDAFFSGALAVNHGGTGATAWGQGWFGVNDSGAFVSSTSPTFNYITATSTATSTFQNGWLNIGALQVSTTTASSTFANGFNLTNGCVSYKGSCISLSNLTGTVTETHGGTNQTTYTTGDLLYASGSNTLSKLAIGTGGFVLSSVAGVPGWVATSTITPTAPITATFAAGTWTVGCATCSVGTSFSWPWVTTTVFGTTTNSTTTPTWYRTGVYASSTSQFTNSTTTNITVVSNFWNNGITSALGLFDSNHLETAYGGSNPCSNQVALSISATGVITCTSVSNAMLSNSSVTINTTYPLTGGGAVALGSSLTLVNAAPSKWATSTLDSLAISPGGGLTIGVGTSTPTFTITASSSTRPQLDLTDGTGTSAGWFFRSLNGSLYIGTTTPATSATSTALLTWLRIEGNTATSTFAYGLKMDKWATVSTSTGGNGIDLDNGCLSYKGTCITQNAGTVTSVSGSGGTTGLTLTGGAITTSGTLTLGGTLVLANGGTNASLTGANQIAYINSGNTALANEATFTYTATGAQDLLTVANATTTNTTVSGYFEAPIHYGGMAANSSIEFRATGGAGLGAELEKFTLGTNGAIEMGRIMQNGWGFGTTSPRWEVTISSSTRPQLALADGSQSDPQWTFWNKLGDLWLATSSPTTFATSTNIDPNLGYIEFPQNGGCNGCTDLIFTGGINLRNARYVSASSTSLTANTIQDIYTAPAGRRAVLLSTYSFNATVGTVNFATLAKIGANYYQIVSTTTEGTLSNGVASSGFVVEPGATIAVRSDTTGGTQVNIWVSLIEYDASVPLFTASSTAPANATSTLYTVPTGVTASLGATQTILNSALGATISLKNDSVGNVARQACLVKSGQSAVTGMNCFFPAGQTVNAGLVGSGSLAGGGAMTMNSGDSIQYALGTSLAGTKSLIWINVFEH